MDQLTEIEYACNYKIIVLLRYCSNTYVPRRVFSVFSLLNLCRARVAGLPLPGLFSWVSCGISGASGLLGNMWLSWKACRVSPAVAGLLGNMWLSWKACGVSPAAAGLLGNMWLSWKACGVSPAAAGLLGNMWLSWKACGVSPAAAGLLGNMWLSWKACGVSPAAAGLLGNMWLSWKACRVSPAVAGLLGNCNGISAVWFGYVKPLARRPVSCLPASHGSGVVF